MPIPVVITAFADKSFTFVMKTPPATFLIKKHAGITKGSPKPHTDKAGIIHATIGRKSFADADLKSNLVALIDALNKAKPASSKGVYLRKVSLSSTMGAGVRVDQATLAA